MKNEIIKAQKEMLEEIDNLESKLQEAEKIKKEYEDLKSLIKKTMVQIGTENNLEQIKWVTPKGTKITCTLGHIAEFEKQEVEEFDINVLKEKYLDIYKKCLVKKEKNVIVKNATSDTLRITFSKEDK